MSDFAGCTPQMHTTPARVNGSYVQRTMCLLDCQACGVLRPWTSLLASLLLQLDRIWQQRLGLLHAPAVLWANAVDTDGRP